MKLKVTAGVQSGALQAQTRLEIPDSVLARTQGLVSRGVKAAEIDEDGNLIFTLTDGSRANLGRVVGSSGKDGASIRKVWIDTYGYLYIEYGTDEEVTGEKLGRVVGRDGADGDSVRKAEISEDGELILTIGNDITAYVANVGKVVGSQGEPGADGYTPVKGVDYFTEEDKQEIAEAAAELVEEAGGGQAASVLAKNVYFESDLILTEPFGRYKLTNGQVTVPAENRSWYDVFMDAMSEDKNPATTQPSVGVSSGTAKAYEVGTEVTPAYSGAFSAGAYSYDASTGVSVTAWEAANSVTDEKLSTQSGQFAKYTVTDSGKYTITVKATYTDGSIPHTVLGAEYPAGQIRGGTKQATTGAISGFRNSFYGTVTDKSATLDSAAIRALAQKSGKSLSNGASFTVNVPVGAMAVVIAYPATLRELSSVKDVNGMNAEIVSAFTASSADVEGANGYEAIAYRVYIQSFAGANDTANTYKVTI